MDLTAEHRGGIRWYNDFSWHAWIEVGNPRPTVECFYGAINITEASILGQRQTWIQQASLHYAVYFSQNFYLEHGIRTPNEAFFHLNPKLLGLGRQFGQISFGTFEVFLAELSAPILVLWVPCPCFPQTIKPLYSNPKYLFGLWIWIWAAKN